MGENRSKAAGYDASRVMALKAIRGFRRPWKGLSARPGAS